MARCAAGRCTDWIGCDKVRSESARATLDHGLAPEGYAMGMLLVRVYGTALRAVPISVWWNTSLSFYLRLFADCACFFFGLFHCYSLAFPLSLFLSVSVSDSNARRSFAIRRRFAGSNYLLSLLSSGLVKWLPYRHSLSRSSFYFLHSLSLPTQLQNATTSKARPSTRHTHLVNPHPAQHTVAAAHPKKYVWIVAYAWQRRRKRASARSGRTGVQTPNGKTGDVRTKCVQIV